ncbi:hypothetical protein MTO96_023184 [Rhipicephalus appendiculatus]
MVSEQILRQCDERLAVFLKEQGCNNLDTLATTADQYLEVQGIVNLSRGKEEKGKPMAAAKVYCQIHTKPRSQHDDQNSHGFILIQLDRSKNLKAQPHQIKDGKMTYRRLQEKKENSPEN